MILSYVWAKVVPVFQHIKNKQLKSRRKHTVTQYKKYKTLQLCYYQYYLIINTQKQKIGHDLQTI